MFVVNNLLKAIDFILIINVLDFLGPEIETEAKKLNLK